MSMSAITRAYIASRHGQLHYRIARPAQPASAPPLLCLHQTPASGADWLPVMADLADCRVVVAPDTPGYGMSDPPPEPLGIGDFAAIMTAFMDDLAAAGIVAQGPFDVAGMHTGSVTATELAGRLPQRVRRVVLFGIPAYPAEIRAEKLATLREKFPVPGNDLAHVEKLWAVISKLSDPRMSAEHRHVGMAECLRLGSRMPWGYVAVYRYDLLAALPRITQPVLVVNPEDDLWAVTGATAGLIPDARRLELPGIKHGVLSIAHDQVVGAIRSFLEEA